MATRIGTDDLAASVMAASREDFYEAAARIAEDAIRTPLLLHADEDGRTIFVKAECLQPLGSFKIRAAANAIAQARPKDLTGIVTASAGNFAQGLALAARRRSLPLTVHAPDYAADVKLASIAALGATVVRHPFERWWAIMCSRAVAKPGELFIHPVCEPGVILGNGTIGIELAEQRDAIDAIVIPIGGGGLAAGIALAMRALGQRPRIIGCEVETAAPLSAAFAAGGPVRIERHPSFVDGIGSSSVLDEMWPLLRVLVDEVIVVSLDEVRAALAELAVRNHLVAEGAGAAAVAAARRCPGRNVVAIVSGGNIDGRTLAAVLGGQGEG